MQAILRRGRAEASPGEAPASFGRGALVIDAVRREVSVGGSAVSPTPTVAADERDRIFDRFWRSPDAAAIGGTGVGLAVVLQLVTAHQGAVDIASRPGGGTVFTVRLPHEARRSRPSRA